MNKQWIAKKIGIFLLCAAFMAACSNNATTTSNINNKDAGAATAVQSGESTSGEPLASIDIAQEIKYDEDDSYTDWASTNPTVVTLSGAGASVEGSGAEVKGSIITITAAGTYAVTGKLDDGQIVVNVPDDGVVRLILNGAEISNSTTSAIYVEEAGKTILSLAEGTENLVSDGETYVFPDAATDEPNAAIFSKDDLTINGTGKLVVEGNYNNGIASKDKLKIMGGALDITAVDDGLMGRDLLAVQDGDITVNAGGHAMKTTNDTVSEEGFLAIDGGAFNLKSVEDAVHSAGGIQINEGDLTINAGDDAIHAETSLLIAGGTTNITNSNEGLEASHIVIADGVINVVAADDGVNAASASSDEAATTEQQAGPGSQGSSNNMITITGGYLTVDAQGDGLDANGSIAMSGGTVIVNGPTNGGNGSLDYDGNFDMTGGFLVAAGSPGMVQATSDESTQAGILMTYTDTQQAGTLVHVEDSKGNAIITFAPSKTYQSVFISSPSLVQNATYTLYSGGTSTGTEVNGLYDGGEYQGGTKVVEFETATLNTWLNESGVTEARSGMMGGRGGGGFGGGAGGERVRPEGGEAPPQ
ncbi:MAG: carbohydrate-binding domain-containing protein [Candidatus Pristimantibacillus sp.]